MLKFIRKYQLFILVIGGSLLMVVFLLQPVLTRLAPNPAKRRAATLGEGEKITYADLDRARFEAVSCARIEPGILRNFGLNPADDQEWGPHWLLLVREAKKGGFVGGVDDGLAWISDLAPMMAQQAVMRELQSGGQLPPDTNFEDLLAQYESQASAQLRSRIQSAAAAQPGATIDDVHLALTHARGIQRMFAFYARVPKPSRTEAIVEAKDALDAVQTDFLVIPGSLIRDDLPPATEEELEAFFQEHREETAAESEVGVGYVLPARIKLSALMIDYQSITQALEPDRVELNKRWRQDRETYPGEFADERARVEAAWRSERADEIMLEVDQIVRAKVRSSLSGVQQTDGYYDLPEGWDERRPRWRAIADGLVDELLQTTGVRIATPGVQVVDDRWLVPQDIVGLPGMRSIVFQVGSRRAGPSQLPQMVGMTGSNAIAPVQVGVPLAELAGVDAISRDRVYITVLDHRPVSAAESIEEAGRERVVADEREVRAYRELERRADEFIMTARADGLGGLADQLDPDDADPLTPRALTPAIAVQITRDNAGRTSDRRLNTPEVRDAILDAAGQLDPLVDPETIAPADALVSVGVPGFRSLVIGRIIAPRPLTREDFQMRGTQAVRQATNRWLLPEDDASDNLPYTFENLKQRWNFEREQTAEERES